MEFPCVFTFKIMGKANDDFKSTVIHIVSRHFPTLNMQHITERKSSNGAFLSLSVQVMAENQKQLNAVYHELSRSPKVLMAL